MNGFSEKRYLVSARWWREWCDYVNFEGDDPADTLRSFARPSQPVDERQEFLKALHEEISRESLN
jgi:hypothetical protein